MTPPLSARGPGLVVRGALAGLCLCVAAACDGALFLPSATPLDAGARDALVATLDATASAVDAAATDAATTAVDATATSDAATTTTDGGGTAQDAGAPPADAGSSTADDAGLPWPDAGAGTADSGCPQGMASCEPFSIVLMPDTQYYTNKQPDDVNNTYRKQARWIRDHSAGERIQFTVHLGDITNNNTEVQWAAADHAHDILDQAAVPYSVTTGNHDYLRAGAFDRGYTLFESTFSASRFAGRPWWGGTLGASSFNNYTFFEVGPLRFLVISLEYAPRKDTLCRAEQLIQRHPDRRVIIATHCYLTHGGAYATCPDPDYLVVGSDGETVWNELASCHSNVFLVVSGHVGESAHVPRQGHAGNTVHQLVVDYQFEAACSASSAAQCSDHCRAGTYTGNGWLRQMVFDPRLHQVRSRTFSVEDGNASMFPGGEPVLFCSELNTSGHDNYASSPLHTDHQPGFAYDMNALPASVRDDAGLRAFTDRTVNGASAGDQLAPRAAMAPNGGFAVVWEDDASSADGAGNHDVVVRGFAPGGCEAFGDRAVHTSTAGQQRNPAVAMDSAGNFVVAWEDDGDLNGVYQIHARLFGVDGNPRTDVFTVNSVASGQQLDPSVAMTPDGRFVVAWEDARASDGQYQVWLRGFHADGSERLADRSVHDDSVGVRVNPAVGLDANANVVVAWQDDSDGNGSYQIHARGFGADGSARFARRTINSVADGQQLRPALCVDASGRFVAVWEDDADGDGSYQILGRGFGADGAVRIAEFEVPGAASGTRLRPELAVRGDGAFVVTWQDDSDGNGSYQIHARAFTSDGAQWTPRWTVNRQDSGQQRQPHAALAGGALVVAWEDDLDGNGSTQILARGLDLP